MNTVYLLHRSPIDNCAISHARATIVRLQLARIDCHYTTLALTVTNYDKLVTNALSNSQVGRSRARLFAGILIQNPNMQDVDGQKSSRLQAWSEESGRFLIPIGVNKAMERVYDLIVIGPGAAGLSAADMLLVAAGRLPNVAGMDLDNAGVATEQFITSLTGRAVRRLAGFTPV